VRDFDDRRPAGGPALGERRIGAFEKGRSGPLVFLVGGVHGNEPEGLEAGRRVLARLARDDPPFRGRVVLVAGNLTALARGRRFVDLDLNRMWTETSYPPPGGAPRPGEPVEFWERRALAEVFAEECRAAEGRRIACLDLHSCSSEGAPFACMGDTIRNRRLAFALPIPVLLGLEETLDGTLLDHFYVRGHVAVAVEGGRSGLPSTVERLEDLCWFALAGMGCLETSAIPGLEERRARLTEACAGLPRVLEIRYREALEPGDRFEMGSGFRTFDRVERGRLLARKNGGECRAPEDGYLLLPLYQGQGNDGFFLGRRVRPFWLRVSAILRRLRVFKMLPLLPGVRRDPDRPRSLVVDPAVARWRTIEILHLLGYRKERPRGGLLVFSRRPD